MSRTTIHLPLLDSVRIASPCPVRWEDMTGDERVRHCAQCDLDVHDLSAMTRVEAEGMLAKLAEGRVCAQFWQRADGTIITRDCPIGVAAARKKLLLATSRIAAALGLAVLAASAARAAQDKSWGNYGWSMRLSNVAPVAWTVEKVQQLWNRGSPFNGAYRLGGILSLPPGEPPRDSRNGQAMFGPHEWEHQR